MQEIFEGLSVTLSNEDKVLLKDRIEANKKAWIEGAQNDENHVNELRKQSEGKVYSSVERWLKKSTGLKFDDIATDLKGGERFKEMLNIAVSSIKETKDATNQDLQDQLLKSKEEIRKLREDEIPEIESRYKSKFDQKQIETKLTEYLSSMNVIPDKINPARIYAKAVLKDRFKILWNDEANDMIIKTPQDLAPVIDDKTATTTEVLKSILDEGGFVQKSNGTNIDQPISPSSRTPGKVEFSENARKMAEELGIKI